VFYYLINKPLRWKFSDSYCKGIHWSCFS